MKVEQLGRCAKCGAIPYLHAAYGQFFWACDCPPPQTYTTNHTGPYDVKNVFGGKRGGGME